MDLRVSEAPAASMFGVKEWAQPDEMLGDIVKWAPGRELGGNARSGWQVEGLVSQTVHDRQNMQRSECTFVDLRIGCTA